VVIFITSCLLALVATNFKIIGNKNPPSLEAVILLLRLLSLFLFLVSSLSDPSPARIMHHKILIFNIVCYECVYLYLLPVLCDFKYLKMNYINMHKFKFKWAQLTFSCLLSLLLLFIINFILLLFLFISFLIFLSQSRDAYGNSQWGAIVIWKDRTQLTKKLMPKMAFIFM